MKSCPKCNMRYPDETTRCLLHPGPLVTYVDPRIGTWVTGRYLVEGVMGEGGMAVVYRARQRLSDRYVALKIVGAITIKDEVMAERFRREAKNASKLSHPNIIEIFEHGALPDGCAYIAMELLKGEPMDALVARGPVPLDQALPLMVQCARGIARAHDFDVIHRDLKPENIFLCNREDGSKLVKLLDFGIARSLSDSRLTSQGDLFGTPQYMSPERINGKDATGSADLYALGAVFFELLTARLPFDATDVATYFIKHLSEVPRAPSKYCRGIPPALDELVLRMLAKDPKGRPVDAHELLQTLLQISAEQNVTLPPNVSEEALSSASPTTVGEENLDEWTMRIAHCEEMLAIAFGATELAPQASREQVAECRRMASEWYQGQEARLEGERVHAAAEFKHRDGRQRFGFAIDAVGNDASLARGERRTAELLMAELAQAREPARLAYVADVRALMIVEGKCAMTTPTAELAAAYGAAAERAAAWFETEQAWQAQASTIADCERRVRDLDFQLEELRVAASGYEERAELEHAEHTASAATMDQQSQLLRAALEAVARRLLAPLRLRSDLAAELQRHDAAWPDAAQQPATLKSA